jgi:hypothetical protein
MEKLASFHRSPASVMGHNPDFESNLPPSAGVRRKARVSNRDLAINLNNCVGRHLKDVVDLNGVALHQWEERL